MATNYYSAVTQRVQQSKSPAERAERCAADQRRLKQEAAERRQSGAAKAAASGRSFAR